MNTETTKNLDATATVLASEVEATAPDKDMAFCEPEPTLSMADLKRRIRNLDDARLVAFDMILDAIDEAQGDPERVAALERKLEPWLFWHNASLRVLKEYIAEWRAEGLEG